jgi:hypothetical protein
MTFTDFKRIIGYYALFCAFDFIAALLIPDWHFSAQDNFWMAALIAVLSAIRDQPAHRSKGE